MADGISYVARLSIVTEERQGVLAKVTAAISSVDTNIKNIEATVEGRQGHIGVVIDVTDLGHLQRVMDAVARVDGVLRVERAAGAEGEPERRVASDRVRARPAVD